MFFLRTTLYYYGSFKTMVIGMDLFIFLKEKMKKEQKICIKEMKIRKEKRFKAKDREN